VNRRGGIWRLKYTLLKRQLAENISVRNGTWLVLGLTGRDEASRGVEASQSTARAILPAAKRTRW